MQVLALSGNNMSGSIPAMWARLTNLKLLDVASNNLTGPLPPTYISMRKLVVLDASNNNMNGTIPSLWDFMAGPDYKLKCMVVFGNKGMQLPELNVRKEALEKLSGGRLAVMTAKPPLNATRWCGVGSFGDKRGMLA